MSYYLEPKAAPYTHKPYERQRVRRDIHDAGVVSHKLSGWVSRRRKRQVRR